MVGAVPGGVAGSSEYEGGPVAIRKTSAIESWMADPGAAFKTTPCQTWAIVVNSGGTCSCTGHRGSPPPLDPAAPTGRIGRPYSNLGVDSPPFNEIGRILQCE